MSSAGPDISRRSLLIGGVIAGLGAAGAVGLDAALAPQTRVGESPEEASASDALHAIVPFYGPHQAGISTPAPAHAVFLALDLAPGADRESLRRLMRLLTDDASRLAAGRPALADSEAELARPAASLTVTFGFGPGLVEAAGGPAPRWLRPLPSYAIDRLEERWSGGDLLIQLCAEDPLVLAHARRMLLKDARSFASVRWAQTGFRHAAGAQPVGATMRNLFGQLDGSANPIPGTADFDKVVWIPDGWLAGGTSLVLRRIAMDLDGWDKLDRPGREAVVGRRLDNGAPLTGAREADEPDFQARDQAGFPVIAEYSHMRRARSDDRSQRVYRRGYNYDEPPADGTVSQSGLLFASYQADVDAQYVPLQDRVAAEDSLNQWTTPIGSAVFALPPGCVQGGFVGDALLA